MFLSQPLIEVLAARGIEDIDAFVAPLPLQIPAGGGHAEISDQ
jgi:hypothetical protein